MEDANGGLIRNLFRSLHFRAYGIVRWGACGYDGAPASRRGDTGQGLADSQSLAWRGEGKLGCSIPDTHSAYLNGQSRENSRSALCPKPTVKKPGSGRSPGTLENEKLPFAMRLRYYSLNGPYAAVADTGDAVSMRFERRLTESTCLSRTIIESPRPD